MNPSRIATVRSRKRSSKAVLVLVAAFTMLALQAAEDEQALYDFLFSAPPAPMAAQRNALSSLGDDSATPWRSDQLQELKGLSRPSATNRHNRLDRRRRRHLTTGTVPFGYGILPRSRRRAWLCLPRWRPRRRRMRG